VPTVLAVGLPEPPLELWLFDEGDKDSIERLEQSRFIGSWFMVPVHGSWFMVHGFGSWFMGSGTMNQNHER
jgi:hypothetical protein